MQYLQIQIQNTSLRYRIILFVICYSTDAYNYLSLTEKLL